MDGHFVMISAIVHLCFCWARCILVLYDFINLLRQSSHLFCSQPCSILTSIMHFLNLLLFIAVLLFVSDDATIVAEVWASFISEIYPVINQFTLIVLPLNCSWVMSAFTSTFMYFLSLLSPGEHPPNFYPGILADTVTRFAHLHS